MNQKEQIRKELNEYLDKYIPRTELDIYKYVVDFIKKDRKKQLTLTDVVKSFPNDEEVKAHIDTLPYYGTCTTEYNEGFEDGVKWLKEQLAK